ncbi:DNA/RNA non-specific endonuclease [Nocardioides astragali]|uniref:DNA/RNA non-specific endonuclease n=1 Tax=Nocardioides astragali TaxID=1776736 RepID=A0ABW2N7V3_9ACTN|nr:DNA/RNA non-specific endonuclease [Nocardioides astragali]
MAELGYDSDFLDTTLAPPGPGQEPGGGAGEGALLDYQHFTVQMHPTRRLAWWVAWNIDGLRLFPSDSISRSGEDFRADPRIPATAQTLNDAYAGNRLDRGHVARRSDLLWGTLDEARAANSDSFFFTNITPQMDDFNQSGRGGAWGLLENAVLAQEGLEDRRLTLFAGPVLRDDDPAYRDIVQVPREHWKVVVYRMDGQLRSRSFVLSQDLDLRVWDQRAFLDDFDTYLVPLDLLEERTGLTFTSLRAGVPATELRQPAGPVLVAEAEQVAW